MSLGRAWAIIDTWTVRASRSRSHLIGLSAMRILLGVAAVQFYLADWGRSLLLWGPNSITPREWTSTVWSPLLHSPLELVHSVAVFRVLYAIGFAVAVIFAIRGGRVASSLQLLFMWSLYLRNPVLMEGGDRLVFLLMMFLPLTVSDAHWSPGAARRRAKLALDGGRLPVLLHNAATALIVFQVIVLYVVAGLYKLEGNSWLEGNALTEISTSREFNMYHWYAVLMGNHLLSLLLGYAVIIGELAVVVVLFPRRRTIHWLAVGFLLLMHIGIGVNMGLPMFATIMIGADAALLSDHDYAALRRWLSALGTSGQRDDDAPNGGNLRLRRPATRTSNAPGVTSEGALGRL